jgi:hypothetical protein
MEEMKEFSVEMTLAHFYLTVIDIRSVKRISEGISHEESWFVVCCDGHEYYDTWKVFTQILEMF